MKKLITIIVFALSINAVSAQWTNIVFTAGLDVLTDIYFLDVNTGFVCGYQGSGTTHTRIFKTTNGGATWTQVFTVTDNNSIGQSHSLHEFQFTSPSTGFCVGGRNGLYPFICKTTNGGNSWDTISLTTPNFVVSIDFPDATTGYMCGEPPVASTSFYKSTDGGATWTDMAATIAPQIAYCPIKDVEFVTPNDGYAVTLATSSTQAGIYKTSDGGVTWTQQYTIGNNEGFTAVQFINANDGFVSGLIGKVYKTSNGGITWTPIPVTSISNDVQDIHFVNPNIGYAASTAGFSAGIYKTTNGGSSWTLDNSGGFSVMIAYGSFSFVGSTAYACGQSGYSKTTTAPVGIDESVFALEADLFPNPANNSINIALGDATGSEPVTVEICDVTGAVIRRNEYLFASLIEMNTENLNSGTYIMRVRCGDRNYSERFVVAR